MISIRLFSIVIIWFITLFTCIPLLIINININECIHNYFFYLIIIIFSEMMDNWASTNYHQLEFQK